MSRILICAIFILFLLGCNHRYLVCNCCESTYELIADAQDCISNNPDTATTSDDRLFLLAIHNFEDKDNKILDWSIISDVDIQNTAKQNYLLIFQHRDSIGTLEDNDRFTQILEEHSGDSLFFIIANQAIYPFDSWNLNSSKERIIDVLQVGDGP
ncbi:hypothetical protein [Fulvivirga ligni]|uniref:hypothetical protein n=1 Tax=Fulvivirga ligni TaxID=2904246 RepID=UPI001F3F438E|nr:hypothetical protein [Fulvivirga ligni]UII20724.1 hypothetical protein LVD16_23055 [Fulvivirga ligni]